MFSVSKIGFRLHKQYGEKATTRGCTSKDTDTKINNERERKTEDEESMEKQQKRDGDKIA